MKNNLQLVLNGLLGVLILTSCSSTGAFHSDVPTLVYSTSAPIATQVKALPTSIPQGQVITYKDLRVTMTQAEITNGYDTEYGSRREPTLGGKFLWIQVQLENIGPTEHILPAAEHFSVLYGESEFKSSYGHRKGSLDYAALKPNLYQGQKVAAWLRFDIPSAAELQALQFAFLPESVQISFSFPTANYSWADHPIYFWQCNQ